MKPRLQYTLLVFTTTLLLWNVCAAEETTSNTDSNRITKISDFETIKGLLKSKNNLMIYYYLENSKINDAMHEVAKQVYDIATIGFVHCAQDEDLKKLCKKMKADPKPFVLKYYRNGEFNKNYDRQMTASGIVAFLRNPDGDVPWVEDPILVDTTHIVGDDKFVELMNHKKPTLVLFYDPHCPHCQKLKTDYGTAATELKTQKISAIMAVVDMRNPANKHIAEVYKVAKVPTLHFFDAGTDMYPYLGAREKKALVAFMKEPTNPFAVKPAKNPNASWSEDTGTALKHLDKNSFESILAKNEHVLAVFYANWCSHCKKLRPILEEFVELLEKRKLPLIVVGIDGEKNAPLLQRYVVSGYPTLRYFKDGVKKFDVSERTLDGLLRWAKDPSKQPHQGEPWNLENTNVVKLTTKNADDLIEEYRNAFIVYYTPWCGHCKAMKDDFVAFAKDMKKEPNLLIGAVDCTKDAGLCRNHKVGAYPTIHYYRNGEMNHKYKGGRSPKEFHDFLWLKIREEEQEFEEKKDEDEEQRQKEEEESKKRREAEKLAKKKKKESSKSEL